MTYSMLRSIVEPLYKGTLKSNLTLNNSQYEWNKMIYCNRKITIEI